MEPLARGAEHSQPYRAKWVIDTLIKALDISKDGQISRDEWSSAWARSEAALRAASAMGHTDLESKVSVLTQVTMRPPDVDFADVRRWTRVQQPRDGADGVRPRERAAPAPSREEERGERGWPVRSVDAEAAAAGCAIPETAVRPDGSNRCNLCVTTATCRSDSPESAPKCPQTNRGWSPKWPQTVHIGPTSGRRFFLCSGARVYR